MNYYVGLACTFGLISIVCLCVYINLTGKEIILNKRKTVVLFIFDILNYFFIGNLFINDIAKFTFVPFFLGLILMILIFYTEKKRVIVSWMVSMFIIEMISILLYPKFVLAIVNPFVSEENKMLAYNITKLLFVYCISITCYIFRKYIRNLEEVLNENNKSRIILAVFVVIVQCMRVMASKIYFFSIENITTLVMILLSVVVLYLIVHSIKIEKRVQYTEKLNEQLERKNNDLRKIKHDYGAQISYLYGLYLLKRWDSLGEAINNIVENNESVQSSVLLNKNRNSIIAKSVDNILHKGIHVIIEENAEAEIMDINKEDMSLIIKKTSEAVMKIAGDKGLIKIKTYIQRNKFLIVFKSYKNNNNNGMISRIKENSDDVKKMKIALKDFMELISKNGGKTYVKKDNEILKVKIQFKI